MSYPYVRFALAKAVKKGEDYHVSFPTCAWPEAGGFRKTPGPRTYGLYAVVDGHNGAFAAEFTANQLPSVFAAELLRALTVYDGQRDEAVATALGATFLSLDAAFAGLKQISGATLTVVIQLGWTISVANIGDSRAILDTGRAEILQLTFDFRLEDSADERARVLAGGGVLRRLAENGHGPCRPNEVGYGPLRVWPGGLALSRAIGDFDVGPSIIASPFIKQLRVPQTAVRIIIASDGVWDACSNAVAAKPVRRADTESAASAIVAGALKLRGLRDDTTVICLDLCPDAEPLGMHWEAQAMKRAAQPRAPRPWPCCGGAGAEEWAHEQPVEELVDELRELDFHTVAPAGATAKASSGAARTPQHAEGLLPRVMPRTSGRLSSRNADNEVSVRPYRDAQAEAAPPGLPTGGMDATEHAGTLFHSASQQALSDMCAAEEALPPLPPAALAAAQDVQRAGLQAPTKHSSTNKGTHHWGDASAHDIQQVFLELEEKSLRSTGGGDAPAIEHPPRVEQDANVEEDRR